MDLFTRCTRCETVFRVTTRDLQASGGQVRCGRCQTVFDAFASLTARPPGQAQGNATANSARSARIEKTETDPHKPVVPELALLDTEPDESAPRESVSNEPLSSEPVLNEPVPAEPIPQKPVSPKSTRDRSSEPVATADAQKASAEARPHPPAVGPPRAIDRFADHPAINLYEWEFKPAPKRPRTSLWLSLSLLLSVVASAQAAYIFRTHLMVNYPQVRPLYEQACVWLSCEIGLPRLADKLDIDASDLQVINAQKPSQVELTALVRNRARIAVEYPAFELTLSNEKEQVVARRVFSPDEYLSDEISAERGFAGRGELAVRLFLDVGPLRAAGYRIYLFYPT